MRNWGSVFRGCSGRWYGVCSQVPQTRCPSWSLYFQLMSSLAQGCSQGWQWIPEAKQRLQRNRLQVFVTGSHCAHGGDDYRGTWPVLTAPASRVLLDEETVLESGHPGGLRGSPIWKHSSDCRQEGGREQSGQWHPDSEDSWQEGHVLKVHCGNQTPQGPEFIHAFKGVTD